MKNRSNVLNVFRVLLQIILYIPIQVIMIPFAIIGFIVAIYREMYLCKKLNVSFTAIQSLQYRWIMHYFDTRKDDISIKFIKKFPCESHWGLCCAFGALIISQRLFGFKTSLAKLSEIGEETIVSTPGRRLQLFDEIIEKYVDEVDQIVIPGSGFDMLSQRYTNNKAVKVYEIDQADTMNLKVKTLEKANIDSSWITFIPIDYAQESWVQKLEDAGFDKNKKTLFIWQSVSLYLEKDLVDDMLHKMSEICSQGSIVVQDLYSQKFALGETSKTVKKSANFMGKMGEPWKFGLDMSNKPKEKVNQFMKKFGLNTVAQYHFGEKLEVDPFYCIVEAIKI